MTDTKPRFYECGICGAWHRWEWNGDCREDAARYFADELDAQYGLDWIAHSMEERVAADAGEFNELG